MGPVDAVKSVYRNYFAFSGRATRSEFWWYTLFGMIVGLVISLVEGGWIVQATPGNASLYFEPDAFSSIWSLVNFIPAMAVGCRRLHDIDKSGWWQLLVAIPLVGIIILIVWWASPGRPGANRFGPPLTGQMTGQRF